MVRQFLSEVAMKVLKNLRKIAVGVSGGVDSAVAALTLKSLGHHVVGVFMKNWDLTDETGHCSTEDDRTDALYVCKKLGIPFHEVNFVKPYWSEVFLELLDSYQNGMTPNPDILCNKFIKFSRFWDHASGTLDCDMIATGHYARVSPPDSSGAVRLLKARDTNKDQTFFLSQIPQSSLRNTVFPLGDLMKCDVKKIAVENNLEKIAKKKESMGMCFIGNRHFPSFIEDYIESKEGDFIDFDTGRIVGRHFGKHQFTIGQRCKLGGFPERLYVARRTEKEDIYIAAGHEHPIFYGRYVFTAPAHWIHSRPPELLRGSFLRCQFRFQHREPLVGCIVFERSNNELVVVLDTPLRSLTPGQYSVFYKGEECLGSSRILYSGPSEFVVNYSKNAKNKQPLRLDSADEILSHALA